jgi:hypothetical protein
MGTLEPHAGFGQPDAHDVVSGAANYVTGTHSVKVGMDLQSGSRQNQWLGLSSLSQHARSATS